MVMAKSPRAGGTLLLVCHFFLVLMGPLILFAMAFNGGFGNRELNTAIVLSSIAMMFSGAVKMCRQDSLAYWSAAFALVMYLPLSVFRIFWEDYPGLVFDFLLIAILGSIVFNRAANKKVPGSI